MMLEQLREEVVLLTRRACEGIEDPDLARRIAAARSTCAADNDDALAPARGVITAIGLSALLLLAAVVLIGALA